MSITRLVIATIAIMVAVAVFGLVVRLLAVLLGGFASIAGILLIVGLVYLWVTQRGDTKTPLPGQGSSESSSSSSKKD